jgi:hypothetical protein
MDANFLISLKWVVIGAMLAAVGIVALLCGFYALRAAAFRPFFPDRHHEPPDAEEQEEAQKRKDKIESLYSSRR